MPDGSIMVAVVDGIEVDGVDILITYATCRTRACYLRHNNVIGFGFDIGALGVGCRQAHGVLPHVIESNLRILRCSRASGCKTPACCWAHRPRPRSWNSGRKIGERNRCSWGNTCCTRHKICDWSNWGGWRARIRRAAKNEYVQIRRIKPWFELLDGRCAVVGPVKGHFSVLVWG